MSPEDMSFALWQMEQHELKRVKEALRQADSGRLVPHLTVRQLFPLRPTPDASVAVYGRVSPKTNISWSDAVVADLRSSCEYFEQCSSGIDLRDHARDGIFSTVEIISKRPDIGRSGRVRGTREWDSGFESPTIVYRELAGEIQVLGVLVSRRQWPHMKTGTV
jgi:plasmid stabilization system protein ParE